MNFQKICKLFLLFSGETEIAPLLPLIQGAMLEVEGRLRTDADPSDERLTFLAAALANLRHSQMLTARQQQVFTAGGSAPAADTGKNRPFLAGELAKAYLQNARSLLKDDGFVFAAIAAEGQA